MTILFPDIRPHKMRAVSLVIGDDIKKNTELEKGFLIAVGYELTEC